MKRLLAVAVGVALLIAAGSFACALLPERYAVNAPIAQHDVRVVRRERSVAGPVRRADPRAPGFSVGLFAEKLPSVRFLRPLPGGGLLATTPREGKVWLLTPDRDGDGRADAVRPLLEQLNRPHGLDLLGDWLYVAEGDGVGRVRIDLRNRRTPGRLRARGRWSSGGGQSLDAHRSLRTRRMDVRLRRLELQRRASNPTIAAQRCCDSDRMVSEPQIFATGLRNSVGFDWQPGTNALYATDNGRDLLGDDFPPCELNLVALGGFYGWPFANGDRVPDPNLGAGQEERIRRSIPPVHRLRRAHRSARDRLPAATRAARRVARRRAGGVARIVEPDRRRADTRSSRSTGEPTERSRSATSWSGFEQDENVIGRPVDVAEGADGTIYVSDDYASSVYWVKYGAAAP